MQASYLWEQVYVNDCVILQYSDIIPYIELIISRMKNPATKSLFIKISRFSLYTSVFSMVVVHTHVAWVFQSEKVTKKKRSSLFFSCIIRSFLFYSAKVRLFSHTSLHILQPQKIDSPNAQPKFYQICLLGAVHKRRHQFFDIFESPSLFVIIFTK